MADVILIIKVLSLLFIPIAVFGGLALPLFVKSLKTNGSALSYCNILSGSILLGFGFLTMLPEAIEDFKDFGSSVNNFPVIYAIVFTSFFLVLLAEQWLSRRIAQYKKASSGEDGKDQHHSHSPPRVQENIQITESNVVDSKIVPLLPPITPASYDGKKSHHSHHPKSLSTQVEHHHDHSENSLHTHDVSFISHESNSLLPYLLTGGLAFHSIFEGIVLGLQPTLNGLVLLLVGICLHKFGEGFAMGVNFLKSNVPVKKGCIVAAIFSVTCPLGIIIGLGLGESLSEDANKIISSLAGALACGIFLYVSIIGIFIEEFTGKHSQLRVLFAAGVFLSMGFLSLL